MNGEQSEVVKMLDKAFYDLRAVYFAGAAADLQDGDLKQISQALDILANCLGYKGYLQE